MTLISLPYNPVPGGAEDITEVMADFAAILAVVNGDLRNDNVAAAAAIARSKLNFGSGLVDADISSSAELAVSKLAEGSAGSLLKSTGSAPSWSAVGGSGALLYGSGSDVAWSNAGTNGQELRNVSGVPTWFTVPAARAYKTTGQTITNNTFTAVNLNAERFDTDTMHDNATNNTRLTVNTAGTYLFMANVSFVSNASGIRQLLIRVGGANDIAQTAISAVSGANTIIFVAALYTMVVTNYVEMIVRQTSGGDLAIGGNDTVGDYSPELSAVRITA